MKNEQLTTTVYVRLLDEGTDVWRPVLATPLGDMYRLEGPKPDDERWQFEPGALVRCTERRFEGELVDRLVAVEAVGAAARMCCFCGAGLVDHEAVELVAYPSADRDEAQGLWAHARCLAERLHPSVPRHPSIKP
jgi:hypothetical protein